MIERMSGGDALMWHLESADTPMHTLKVLVLDPSRRGRPVTLDEVHAVIGPRLGLVERSTQKVVAPRGFGGLPLWVDDPDFELRDHLDEQMAGPGGLDEICSDLASEMLPRDRSPWALTLVHGLASGQQAVVIRVHHALTDGLGALNAFLACTSEDADEGVPHAPARPAARATTAELTRIARAGTLELVRGIPSLLAEARRTTAHHRRFRAEHPDLPRFREARRTSLNAPSGAARTCATASLPLATMKAIGKETGVSVNGVLHAVVAGAVRTELIDRGESVDEPTVACFGVAADPKTTRRHGNDVTPTSVALASQHDDPVDRLRATADSCRDSVELRRTTGGEVTRRWTAYGPRVVGVLRRFAADRAAKVVNHVTTANVAGPRTTRWLGDIEIVDWFSFAVSIAPANVNLTVYSYAGRMNMGLVATPEALPRPDLFLERMQAELDTLAAAVLGATDDPVGKVRRGPWPSSPSSAPDPLPLRAPA